MGGGFGSVAVSLDKRFSSETSATFFIAVYSFEEENHCACKHFAVLLLVPGL